MTVGNSDIAFRKGGTGQQGADRRDIEDQMLGAKPGRAIFGKSYFFFVTLAVIEGEQGKKLMLGRSFMGEGDGVQSAGTDDKRFHFFVLVLFNRVGPRPVVCLRRRQSIATFPEKCKNFFIRRERSLAGKGTGIIIPLYGGNCSHDLCQIP